MESQAADEMDKHRVQDGDRDELLRTDMEVHMLLDYCNGLCLFDMSSASVQQRRDIRDRLPNQAHQGSH